MRLLFTLIIFHFLSYSSCGINDTTNKQACLIVEKYLNTIKSYLDNNKSDSSGRRVESISFLEHLTLIESESDGTYFGKLFPTKKDYDQWHSWYLKNKSSLFLNKETNTVYLNVSGSQFSNVYNSSVE